MCDMPSVSEERTVRAAREHECSMCHWTIARGETHVVISGCWDGEWSRYRMHQDCRSAHAALAVSDWSDGCAVLDSRDLEPEVDVLRDQRGRWTAILK